MESAFMRFPSVVIWFQFSLPQLSSTSYTFQGHNRLCPCSALCQSHRRFFFSVEKVDKRVSTWAAKKLLQRHATRRSHAPVYIIYNVWFSQNKELEKFPLTHLCPQNSCPRSNVSVHPVANISYYFLECMQKADTKAHGDADSAGPNATQLSLLCSSSPPLLDVELTRPPWPANGQYHSWNPKVTFNAIQMALWPPSAANIKGVASCKFPASTWRCHVSTKCSVG